MDNFQHMRKLHYFSTSIIVLLLLYLLGSCHKNEDVDNAKLTFSSTEVCFDTVFTTVGSVTKNFTVRNPHSFAVTFSAELAGGKQSPFSINVDGEAGTFFKEVTVAPHDSIFVHVVVNINPNDQNLPFIVTDSVIFRTGKNIQDVDLVAFGQNAHFIVADQGSASLRYKIIAHEHETVRWTNDLPYVVYGGFAAVDSLGTLIIDPGTTIYFHKGAGIWVYRYGNIQAQGTIDNPIIFRGDQLSSWYNTDYNQWDRIWINEGTEDNIFENCIIQNSFIGLQLESLSQRLNNQTIIRNSIIKNTHNSGVLARNSKFSMENCQISNNGNCSLQLQIGDFSIKHTTIANYFSQSARQNPAVYISNLYSNEPYDFIGEVNVSMVNSIVYGISEEEFAIYEYQSDQAPIYTVFENCLIKKKSTISSFINCILNQNPLFTNNNQQDYTLQSGSPAIDAGKTGLNITTDLKGNPRDSHPDIGAYEYQ